MVQPALKIAQRFSAGFDDSQNAKVPSGTKGGSAVPAGLCFPWTPFSQR
jgi:hypothetical protein